MCNLLASSSYSRSLPLSGRPLPSGRRGGRGYPHGRACPLGQLLGTPGAGGIRRDYSSLSSPSLVRRPCPNRESPSPLGHFIASGDGRGGEPPRSSQKERERPMVTAAVLRSIPPPPPLFCAFGRESNRRSGVRARGRKCRHKKGEGKEKNNSNPRFRHRERERGCRGVRGESAAGMTGQRGGTCP